MNTVMRAPKTGFAYDAWEKVRFKLMDFYSVTFDYVLFIQIQSKYDVSQAHEALEWICEMIGEQFDTSGDMDNVYNQLRDGRKLCK